MKKTTFLLILLTIVLRLVPIWGNKFSFMFDNAKDSLIIMQIGTQFKPSLVGAVTSIPGVYYGPAWYYLSLPINFLMGFHPLASVLTVIIFACLITYLITKQFGNLAGLLFATSHGLVASQTSAWSPYLMSFITALVLILLYRLLESKGKCRKKSFLLLFLVVSLGFHFQPAFAVVLLPIVVLILVLLKVNMSLKMWILGILVFFLPFIPHLIFELRHDFHQSRQVIAFIKDFSHQSQVVQPNQPGMSRVAEIGGYIINQAGTSVVPQNWPQFGWVVLVVGLLFLLQKKAAQTQTHNPSLIKQDRVIFLSMVFGTLLMYQFLPSKSYYLVALIPVFIIWWSKAIHHFWPQFSIIIAGVIFVMSLFQLKFNIQHGAYLVEKNTFMFAAKMEAVEKVYQLANNQSFVSYQFVPEIYDFPYQHIFLYLNRRDPDKYYLPIEFSYAPGETSYIPSKKVPIINTNPERVFIIVEDYYSKDIFESWWQRVVGEAAIVSEYDINQTIKVFEISNEKNI